MIRLGHKLHEERIRLGLSLEDVEKATKIRASFLEAIEKGEYKKLPSSAYIQGFVKNYASYLGFPAKEAAALFRREFNEKEYVRVLPEGLPQKDDIPIGGIRFGQRVLVIIGVFSLLFVYLFFQYRYAFLNPPLTVSVPKQGEVVSQTIMVSGKTDPNATVFVNDFPVTLDTSGIFSKKITAFPGKTTIKIRSVNRFGKTTVIDRNVEVKAD